jgi:hypothetical protein
VEATTGGVSEVVDVRVATSEPVLASAAEVRSARAVLADIWPDVRWVHAATELGWKCLALAPYGHILRLETLESRATYLAWAREAFAAALAVAADLKARQEVDGCLEGLIECEAAEGPVLRKRQHGH